MSTTLNLIQDGDDVILELTEEVCKAAGWQVGDTIEFHDNKDGSFTMKKKEIVEETEEFEYVIVDTVSSFNMKYIIKVPKGKKEWALDSVTMEEAIEFDQKHIGEMITDSRVISEEEILQRYREQYPTSDRTPDYLITAIDSKGNLSNGK